ncbi:hypothetical protein GRI89_10085 [Altererythrobacter salegens]|uniref:Uncharacterized protein n=1 Tax=Croceibacterium salegens TaxID=1737568 RepID=A0A6I4SXY1_9SPHN|nr:hypothetical protein [Croceibacterium salegens]
MNEALETRVSAMLAREVRPEVVRQAQVLGEEAGALAVLFYGSNLRTGSLEGVLDYYALLPGPAETGLWPRVSYREWDDAGTGERLRAKFAEMSLAKFAEAASGRSLDTTIWARFVQPSAMVWAKDEAAAAAVREAIAEAARTAARLAAALGPAKGQPDDYWKALFRATYRAELRVEAPGRENSILAANPAHFDGLLRAALVSAGVPFRDDGGHIAPQIEPGERRAILNWWNKRRRLGKALNAARLVRANSTFAGAPQYIAWKIERHTGVAVEVTPWREKHPLLAAPGVLWKVWRSRRKPG